MTTSARRLCVRLFGALLLDCHDDNRLRSGQAGRTQERFPLARFTSTNHRIRSRGGKHEHDGKHR